MVLSHEWTGPCRRVLTRVGCGTMSSAFPEALSSRRGLLERPARA